MREQYPDGMPLNNLDMLDLRGTSNPYEGLLDEPPTELSTEEKYAEATPQELLQLAMAKFYEGYGEEATRQKKLATQKRLVKNESSSENLVTNNLLFALMCVRRYAWHLSQEDTIADRIQSAYVGLQKAAEKYDKDAGKFLTYAKVAIVNTIQNPLHGNRGGTGVQDSGIIRVPETQSAYHRIKKFRQKLSTKYKRELELEEILDSSAFTVEEIDQYIQASFEHLPFHKVFKEELSGAENPSHIMANHDPLADPEQILEHSAHGHAQILLRLLSENEATVLLAHLGLDGEEPKSLQEIANERGYSRHYAWCIKTKALAKLGEVANALAILEGLETIPKPSKPRMRRVPKRKPKLIVN